jgi:chromosome partitioning protein
MLTISVIGQKGGDGKSTLAAHLSAQASAAGLVAACIDADPQKTLHAWFERREAEAPQVTRETDADELRKLARRAAAGGCDVLLIDTSGRAEATMREAADLGDIILTPVTADRFSVETLPVVQKVVRFVGKDRQAWLVPNKLKPLARDVISREERELREGLAAQGWQVAPIALHRLDDFTKATNDGRVAQEMAPEGRAADEVRALWAWVHQEARAHVQA